jgi:hypothetical protein
MNIQLIEGWPKFYKLYSVWVIAALAALPDIYNVCLTAGFFEGTSVPELYARATNIIGVGGVILRLIKQQKAILPV